MRKLSEVVLKHLHRRLLGAGVLVILALILAGVYTSQQSKPFASAEVNFTDKSPGGLSIVPASCPSNPHCSGQCDVPPTICTPSYICRITFDRYTIAPGESATMGWNIYTDQWSSIQGSFSHGLGSVPPLPAAGTMRVSPSQTTSYSFTGKAYYFGQFIADYNCASTLYVGGSTCTGDGCPPSPCTGAGCPTPSGCPSGYTYRGGQCVGACEFYSGGQRKDSEIGGGVPDSSQGGICSCSAKNFCSGNGLWTQNTSCVATLVQACAYGCSNGACNPPSKRCAAQFFCSGSDLYYRNNQCATSFAQSCTWGCANGICNPPPAPEGDIRVSPALVKSGETTQVIWSTQYVTSCTVTGTNGDKWTELSSGSQGKKSSPITERVEYTLLCQAHAGARVPTLTKTAIVNLIPSWQED